MSVPSVLVQMETEKRVTYQPKPFTFENEVVDVEAGLGGGDKEKEVVNFELSQASLATMLEGLGKIRDQLNSVATKTD